MVFALQVIHRGSKWCKKSIVVTVCTGFKSQLAYLTNGVTLDCFLPFFELRLPLPKGKDDSSICCNGLRFT